MRPFTPRPISVEESRIIEKMAEAYTRNPELVAKVLSSQRGNPKYDFLHEDSPIHFYYRWRISQLQSTSDVPNTGVPPLPCAGSLPGRPCGLPPLSPFVRHIASLPHVQGQGQIPPLPSDIHSAPRPEVSAERQQQQQRKHRYFELPAGLMVKAIGEAHTPYSALRTVELEAQDFLESVSSGLASYSARVLPPKDIGSDLSSYMEHFEKGVRYIYKEGEYADDMSSETLTQTDASPPELTIDKEGWEPGVLEKVLWDRRRSQTEQRQRRRGQERGLCGNIICNLSDVSESLHSSTSDGSSADTSSRSSAGSDCTSADTDSESDSNRSSASSSGSDAHRGVAQATSVNKALGSDNVGFKLLAKLGWQQGQGLGAAGDGIVEPIRLQTRFSTVRGASARGRRRGRFHSKGTERASLGIGRQKASGAQKPPPVANTETDTRLADDFESYRKQMSSAYKHSSSTQRHLHRDKPQDTP